MTSEKVMPMEGKLLAGRYQIRHILGTGGMATVYKAYDNVIDREVAIKIMNQRLVYDHEYVRRFVWEAQATGRLSHPNIVNLYDAGQEGPLYYMVMEYVEGQTLKQRIHSKTRLSAKEALQIAIQICNGLQHAHSHGIVHRDIKPHNIMCSPDGRYKVADFGIARLLRNSSNLTKTGTVMGSIHYFSPEQARGQEIGFPSDLYSLGIVMYEMVTGEVPFHADEDIAVVLMHIQTPMPDPRKINPDIPVEFTQVLRKAMEKDPKKRFQTADEMRKALQSVLQSMGKERASTTRRAEIENLTKSRSSSGRSIPGPIPNPESSNKSSSPHTNLSRSQTQAHQGIGLTPRRKRNVGTNQALWKYIAGGVAILFIFGILLNSCFGSDEKIGKASTNQGISIQEPVRNSAKPTKPPKPKSELITKPVTEPKTETSQKPKTSTKKDFYQLLNTLNKATVEQGFYLQLFTSTIKSDVDHFLHTTPLKDEIQVKFNDYGTYKLYFVISNKMYHDPKQATKTLDQWIQMDPTIKDFNLDLHYENYISVKNSTKK